MCSMSLVRSGICVFQYCRCSTGNVLARLVEEVLVILWRELDFHLRWGWGLGGTLALSLPAAREASHDAGG